MTSGKQPGTIFEDIKVNVKIKLAILWATLMFIYIYVDIFKFFEPGTLEDIFAGKVWEFEITQVWAISAMILMSIPSLMVFLSLVLKANINRKVNIIMGILHIAIAIANMTGETWAYYIFGGVVEVALLLVIIWHAWKWPKQGII